jgi:uncharacterized membrane protein
MDSDQARSGSRTSTARAEAFSDAVLAIIITLLVLDLRPPHGQPGQLLSGLLQQWPTYLAYAASYLYVAVVWLNHKAAFVRIRMMDRGLHWANLGTLATAALLPFPTAVVADALENGNRTDARVAVALYALVGALLSASWWVFLHYLARHPELIEQHVDDAFFGRERRRAEAGMLLYVVGGVLGALVVPPIGLAVFIILPIYYGLTSHGLAEAPQVVRRITPGRS